MKPSYLLSGLAAVSAVTLAIAACDGDANLGGSGAPPDPGADDMPGDAADGTLDGSGPSTSSLSGVWDLTGSAGGSNLTGVMILNDKTFSFELGGGKLGLALDGQGGANVTWTDGVRTAGITPAYSPGTLDAGAFPFPVGGTWTFTNAVTTDHASCTSQLSNVSLLASCNDRIGNRPPGFPSLLGIAHATRASTAPSIFGDLGGVWQFDVENASCTGKIHDEVLEWGCDQVHYGYAGTAKITFVTQGGSVSASGTTSAGILFSGLKR